jgi:diguanylate cyclase (GGDEF)-like protein
MNIASTGDNHILIVEDSLTQLEQLKHLLQNKGYQVSTASNGRQAVDIARQQRPSLIISDVLMPVMDGYEMCHIIKTDAELKAIPVMLLTSLVQAEDIILGLNAQADYYLTKPYDSDYLLERVRLILNENLPQSGRIEGLEEPSNPLALVLEGRRHTVSANRHQILSLLLSTYDHAARRNSELMRAQAELRRLNEQLQRQQGELLTANSRLEALAMVDGLTGLKNHRAFQGRLQEEFQRASRYKTPLSVLMIDVDQFKQYNDAFGHPAGDEVLKSLAQVLTETLRLPDVAARYGGEEFVAILPDTDQPNSLICGERIREAIENASWVHRPITVSIGVASLTNGIEDHLALTALADQALYRSKRKGRNRVTHIDDGEAGSSANEGS